jgi:signal transduction histidine kinase
VNLLRGEWKNVWPVWADEGLLWHALVILIVNAHRAMQPKGGPVTVRTTNLTISVPQPIGALHMPAGDYVRIDVIDTGPRNRQGKSHRNI